MLDSLILNKKSIESIYKTICEYHRKYLAQFGVKLPKLYASKKKFTKDALVLVYLSYDYPNTRKVSKEELTKFVRSYFIRIQMTFSKPGIWAHKLVGG